VIVGIAEESHEAATDEATHNRINVKSEGRGSRGRAVDSRQRAVRKIGWIRDLRVAPRAAHEANVMQLFARTRSVMELLTCSLHPEIWRKGGVKKWLEILERSTQEEK
jgi:hypothetical protein